MPHENWGETPCAYIELANGASATAEELRDWCNRNWLALRCQKICFCPYRKLTGKVQKFVLREQVSKLKD